MFLLSLYITSKNARALLRPNQFGYTNNKLATHCIGHSNHNIQVDMKLFQVQASYILHLSDNYLNIQNI